MAQLYVGKLSYLLIIKRLLDIKWWFWSDSQISKAIPLMLNDDITKFLEYAEAN